MKEFPLYYYDLNLLGNPIDIDQVVSTLNKIAFGSIDGYKIEKVGEKKFFFTLIQKHDSEVLYKKGKGNNVGVDDLESLGLLEDESLYADIYMYIDFSSNNPFMNSLGIISVLKGGKEPSLALIGKFFCTILGLKNTITLKTIEYKNREKYFNENLIRSYSFEIATIKNQKNLGVSGGLDPVWDLKEQFGGKKMKFTVLDKDGLDKDKILGFQKDQGHNFANSATIEVDEAGKKVQQKIDKIRFKSAVSIQLYNKELNPEIVLSKMQENYLQEIPKIREEYK
ncbi:hypothetical protein GW846_03345 [Candidatus Gracilibacteria bacterium]|nr:hypothetical protein [Candidatus Gracilibacteria bacterium]